MYNNNIRTDSEIHQFINSEFRNDRLRLEWPLPTEFLPNSAVASKTSTGIRHRVSPAFKAVVKFEHPRIPAFQPFMKPVSYFLRKQFHAVQCLYQL